MLVNVEQGAPPLLGGGLVQYLNLLLEPDPHVVEHMLQEPHGLQAPFTGGGVSEMCVQFVKLIFRKIVQK